MLFSHFSQFVRWIFEFSVSLKFVVQNQILNSHTKLDLDMIHPNVNYSIGEGNWMSGHRHNCPQHTNNRQQQPQETVDICLRM